MPISGAKREASSLAASPADVADAMYNALEHGCYDGQDWNVGVRDGAMEKFLNYRDVPEAMGFDKGTTAGGVFAAARILSRAKSLIKGVLRSAGPRFAGVRSILHSEWERHKDRRSGLSCRRGQCSSSPIGERSHQILPAQVLRASSTPQTWRMNTSKI